jgi:conjugative transposon TraK protein
MFQKTKNIDYAFRHIRLYSLLFLVGCSAICIFISYESYQLASNTQQKIFILANGKALEAYSADRKDNVPVEAKDHVKMFHHFFFTLDPDDKVIQSNLTKALYLADGSAKQQYDNLKEKGYYANLIAGNISQQIEMDSIDINTITEGYLRNVSRSDNNPHGFLIERWQTLENKDIKTENR